MRTGGEYDRTIAVDLCAKEKHISVGKGLEYLGNNVKDVDTDDAPFPTAATQILVLLAV